MSSSQARVVKVIEECTNRLGESRRLNQDRAMLIAQALADAGLLMADLPAPRTVDRYPGSVCWEVCTDPSVVARRHVGVRVDHMRRITTNITGEVTPDEAREAAYALLAAANYAEQETSNV